ncbi:MAG: hypothetical protein EXS37_07130 [Opitutus sp.]|nr:hypothetical protein [Opitutus sp.]
MSSPENHFARLVQVSRRAPGDAPTAELPAALANRVLVQLRTTDREPVSPWESLSLRAVPLAAAAAAVCLLLNDAAWSQRPDDEQNLAEAFVQEQLAS